MIKILNAEPEEYSDQARNILKSIGKLYEKKLSRKELLHCLHNYDVLIVRLGVKVDKEIIDAGKNLKIIVTATTGLDHINVEYANSKGIKVLSLFGQTEFLKEIRATAELTIGIALSLLRHIPEAANSVKNGIWDRYQFKGYELYNKTAGIIGMGRLGTIVAGLFKAFGMKVIGYDLRVDNKIENAERVDSIDELLSKSDIISLHVNLNEKSNNLLSKKEFSIMKLDAILINTSRGGIIDEDALLEALIKKTIAGAALDVISGEPEISTDHPLINYARNHSNLIIVPHIGGNTYESFIKTEVFMANLLNKTIKRIFQ